MNAQDINTTFDLLALVQQHTTLKRSGQYWSGPCPFDGGKDRFELKRSERGGYVWRCRHCAPDGYSSPIDYFMKYRNLDFKAALAVMGGEITRPALNQATLNHPGSAQKRYEMPALPDSDWKTKWLARVGAAADCLNSTAGQPGRDYLAGRGFHVGTWCDYSIGFSEFVNDPMLNKKRPAIALPWLDIQENLTAINYRFMDDQPEGLRYKMVGARTLFGLNCLVHARVLMIVEGEFNCMSIRQAAAGAHGLGLDVVSIGSQKPSGLTMGLLQALVTKYQRFYTWFDDQEKAQAVMDDLKIAAGRIYSLVIDNVKYDANQLLQTGQLGDFLRMVLQDVVNA